MASVMPEQDVALGARRPRGHPRSVAAEIPRQLFDRKDLGPARPSAAGSPRQGPTLVRRLQ